MCSKVPDIECTVLNEILASVSIDSGGRCWTKQSFQRVVSNGMSYSWACDFMFYENMASWMWYTSPRTPLSDFQGTDSFKKSFHISIKIFLLAF